MSTSARRSFAFLVLGLALATQVAAQKDTALGTFTVKGKTIVLTHVTVVRYAAPGQNEPPTLVIVGSDVALRADDLRESEMQQRAAKGALRAIRIEWAEGRDGLVAIPYHPDLADSGEPTEGGAMIDLQRYDKRRLEAKFTSRMVGQDWQFSVRAAATVVDGGTLEPRETGQKAVEPAPPSGAVADATARKRALARLGYEFTQDDFFRAVHDGGLAALDLFLGLGMKATAVEDGTPAIISAAMLCDEEPKAARPQVLAMLLSAGANPNTKDENGSTPLIWAASSCPLEAITILINAGANVNAKAKGGATPLMMAAVSHRDDVINALKAAGAK
jgi:hypothetical protein